MRMGIFSPYSVKYDNPESSELNKDGVDGSTESEHLKKIQEEMDQINDNDKSNDKIEIQGILNTEFRNYLEANPEVAKDLYKAANELDLGDIDDVNQVNTQVMERLMKFLEPIVNPVTVNGTEIDNVGGTENSGDFEGNNSEKSKEPYSYNGIYKIENFNEEKDRLSNKIGKMLEYLGGGDNNLETTLKNIKTVVENPDTNKVKKLQIFLYENLDGKTRDEFLKYNFKRGKNGVKRPDIPDGMFGTHLRDGIDAYLDGLADYVSKVEKSKKIQEDDDSFVKQQQEEQKKQKEEKENQESAEEAERKKVNTLTFEKIISGDEFSKEWDDIKKLSDYSEVHKQIDKVLDIEKSRDLLRENKNLNEEIGKINEQLGKDRENLKSLERDYGLFRENGNEKKNLESLRSDIKNLKDNVERQEKIVRGKQKQISDNESTLSREGSKNEKIQKGLAKLELKLKEKYMNLLVEKQKSLIKIPEGISESTRQKIENENKMKSDKFDKQLNAILKFGSWKDQGGKIVDDPDHKNDYRKYVERIGSLVKIENNQIGTIEIVQKEQQQEVKQDEQEVKQDQ